MPDAVNDDLVADDAIKNQIRIWRRPNTPQAALAGKPAYVRMLHHEIDDGMNTRPHVMRALR